MRNTCDSSNAAEISEFELECRSEVVSERLLDHQPGRRVGAGAQAGLASARAIGREETGETAR